jgi:N6-adenosine-specific RNA methylase IME4
MEKYKIIYADPPWQYNKTASKKGRTVETHYQTMPIDEICALPVREMAAEDAVLFMWATFPKIADGLRVVREWGFDYKTIAFVWVKARKSLNMFQSSFLPDMLFADFMGMGNWTRANAEFVMLGTKGKPKRKRADIRQIVYAPIMEHSRKPDEVSHRIVKLCGDVPRVELFARRQNPGWDVWGNQVACSVEVGSPYNNGVKPTFKGAGENLSLN